MTRRRALLLCMALPSLRAHAADALPMPAGGRPWRIGWLSPASAGANGATGEPAVVAAFVAGMGGKGWVRDRHYTLELRTTNDATRYAALADELLAASPDLLLGIETTARILRQRTERIPIVMLISIDPVAAGLVLSLARPGTNVTGMSGQFDAIVAKWIEAVLELVPRARRIAYLADPGWSGSVKGVLQQAAGARGVELELLTIGADAQSAQLALRELETRPPDALIVPIQGGTLAHAGAIRTVVRRLRLPAVGLLPAGSVVQIGPDFVASARESADFVDRILRGARPADLPVRQATIFEVTVNAAQAREIGVELPLALRVRATRVIE